jgi:hypothetical protein
LKDGALRKSGGWEVFKGAVLAVSTKKQGATAPIKTATPADAGVKNRRRESAHGAAGQGAIPPVPHCGRRREKSPKTAIAGFWRVFLIAVDLSLITEKSRGFLSAPVGKAVSRLLRTKAGVAGVSPAFYTFRSAESFLFFSDSSLPLSSGRGEDCRKIGRISF